MKTNCCSPAGLKKALLVFRSGISLTDAIKTAASLNPDNNLLDWKAPTDVTEQNDDKLIVYATMILRNIIDGINDNISTSPKSVLYFAAAYYLFSRN